MRAYVSLGTLYQRSGRIDEARHLFEEGCAVAEGRNAFIWTAMANLESKVPSVGFVWMHHSFVWSALLAGARPVTGRC
jgi:hypothetical protein